MEDDRYRHLPKSQRPSGEGAFFDYGLAMSRYFTYRTSRASAARANAWRKKRLPASQAQEIAEERWDTEGGSQSFPAQSPSRSHTVDQPKGPG